MTYTGPIADARSRPLRSLPEILKIFETFVLQPNKSDSNFHVTPEQILTNQRPQPTPQPAPSYKPPQKNYNHAHAHTRFHPQRRP